MTNVQQTLNNIANALTETLAEIGIDAAPFLERAEAFRLNSSQLVNSLPVENLTMNVVMSALSDETITAAIQLQVELNELIKAKGADKIAFAVYQQLALYLNMGEGLNFTEDGYINVDHTADIDPEVLSRIYRLAKPLNDLLGDE